MKIFSLICLFTGLFLFTTSCQSGNGNDNKEDSTLVQLHIPVSTETAAQVDSFLQAYYQLKNALVDDDSVAALNQTEPLMAKLNNISLEDIQDKNQKKVVGKELQQLNGYIGKMKQDSALRNIRHYFEEISMSTYQLIRGAGLKDVKVYRTFCPMAFDNKGAYWLSNSSTIRNPYFGHKMINCGMVKETLQF